jgi:ribonucleotide reductase beta subunit family protein with ferritin-like domain
MINTTILDSIILDNRNNKNLDAHLIELDEVPETYINSVCSKSFDEMNKGERKEATDSITEYLKYNVESEEEYLLRGVESNNFSSCEDEKIETLEDFEEDDNLGWKKNIGKTTYYKVRNIIGEARTVYVENDKLVIA